MLKDLLPLLAVLYERHVVAKPGCGDDTIGIVGFGLPASRSLQV